MTERRETAPKNTDRRKGAAGKPRRRKPQSNKPRKDTAPAPDWSEGERIAKYLARAGIASRRACEELIIAGKVSVDGQRLSSPAFKVTGRETIRVNRKIIRAPEATRLWRYYKPSGLITSNHDPAGRRTIFDELPKSLPRLVTVGRLDLTTEGLLLLTNDGELARALELPGNGYQRTYRARAHGRVTDAKIARLAEGMTVEGVRYAPIMATLERETGTNNWLIVTLAEGKKREVRRALEALDLTVNRLIRISYGPFELGDLRPGTVDEVSAQELAAKLGDKLAAPKSRLGSNDRKGRTEKARRPKPRRK